jgi:hypothetical protein
MRLRSRACVALVAVSTSLLSATRARADVRIAAETCAGFDLAEITALVALELADVTGAGPATAMPPIALTCAESSMRIEIHDPLTDKSVSRTIATPTADRERVIGLAIAQLFVTSWLELLLDAQQRPPTPSARAAQDRARDAIVRAGHVSSAALAGERERAVAVELALGLGGRARMTHEHVASGAGALEVRAVLGDSLLVGARLAFWRTSVGRTRGAIDLSTGAVSLVAGVRTPSLGSFFVELDAVLSAALLVTAGDPNTPGVVGGTSRSAAAEAALEVAPTFRAGPVSLGVVLSAGVTFARPSTVSGDDAVDVRGLWGGAMLRAATSPAFW